MGVSGERSVRRWAHIVAVGFWWVGQCVDGWWVQLVAGHAHMGDGA